MRSLRQQIDDGSLRIVDEPPPCASTAANTRRRTRHVVHTTPRHARRRYAVLDDVSDSVRDVVLGALREIGWNYAIDSSKLSETLQPCLIRSESDEETASFMLAQAQAGWMGRAAMALAVDALTLGMSLTDANGILGRGRMCVTSTKQLRTIVTAARANRRLVKPADKYVGDSAESSEQCQLPPSEPGADDAPIITAVGASAAASSSPERAAFRMLDVGAGDGAVTVSVCRALRVGLDHVVATEASAPMARALRARGIHAVETCSLEHEDVLRHAPYDIITVFNVLDRADDPAALLRQVRTLLKPRTGLLVVAVVLPFRPMVEDGSSKRAPARPLLLPPAVAVPGVSFETSANGLESHAFLPAVSQDCALCGV